MASVKRMSDKEKDEAEKLAEIEGFCGGGFLFVTRIISITRVA